MYGGSPAKSRGAQSWWSHVVQFIAILGRKIRERRQGEPVCDSVEHYGHVVKNRTHLNGGGDSERKGAISPQISHHSLWDSM